MRFLSEQRAVSERVYTHYKGGCDCGCVKHQIQPQLSVFLFCTYPLWILADVADGGVGLLNHSVSLILVLDMKRN